jgi:hypothetical protein
MVISSDSEWRTSTDPSALMSRLGDMVTDGERLMILTGFIRPIWAHTRMERLDVRAAMNRLELSAYGQIDDQVCIGTASILRELMNDMAEEEVRDGVALSAHLCHEVAQWATRRTKFDEVMNWLIGQLRDVILYRPEPPPSYQYAPHELPWDWFIHLKGERSIWKQTHDSCKRWMADTTREILHSPYSEIHIERNWLDEDMVHTAFTMFNSGDFTGMSELGEQLENRGCADTDILLHCMAERHFRGCWLIDEITAMRHRLRCF